MMLNEYMTCMRGPEPMTIFSQSHLVEKPSTCSIPYTILLPYWKDHLSLAFERWLWMCAHRRLHITNLASYSRYNRSKPAQVSCRFGTSVDCSHDTFWLLVTCYYTETCKGVLASSNRFVHTMYQSKDSAALLVHRKQAVVG